MFLIDKLLLLAAILMILGILSSKFSARLGLPVLVLFLILGMLAGSEGLGRIQFGNSQIAHGIGTVALTLILFDGGLRSPLESLRVAWKPAALLATLGVLLTSLVTGAVAARVLGLSLLEGMLLGSIVGSTDAAAVFALLRSAGVHLRKRLAATLEIESGANDPMAIFLTLGFIHVLKQEVPLGPRLALLFVVQMGVGLAVGFGIGKLAVMLINRINLPTAGLYPVLTAACGVLAFGVAALLQGSGFLAVYIAGAVLGNSKLVFQRGTLLFHDALAWGGQISMFVVLGLFSTPSELIEIAGPGLLIAGALILLARPIAVVPLLVPFRFAWREVALISWVGLKGAVPVILATYPLIFDLPSGSLLFDVVFFVVLLSAVVQGGSLPWIARLLELVEPPEPEPPVALEISSLGEVDADIVDYLVGKDTRAAGKLLRELALPAGAVAAMIVRGKKLIPPRGSTRILAGDHVFVVLDRESRAPVERLFARDRAVAPIAGELALPGHTTVEQIASLYGIRIDEPASATLDELIRRHAPDASAGTVVELDGVTLRVRDKQNGRVTTVGLAPREASPGG